MGCAQSSGQTESQLNSVLKRNEFEFKDSYDPSERISRQCIAEFSKQIFGTSSPDPTTHKMVWRGTVGPTTVTYDDPNTGRIQFRNNCNVMPEFGCMLWRGTSSRVPDSYQVAINAVELPLQTSDPEYQQAYDNYEAALKAQGLKETEGKNAYTQYLVACTNEKVEPRYDDWKSYCEAEEGTFWSQYQFAVQNAETAYRDLENVQDKLDNNAVLDAINSFNAWSRETDRGTSGTESYWGGDTEAAKIINQWKQEQSLNGGSFTVTSQSEIYEKIAASGDMSLIFKSLKIGITASGSSVFDSSSAYEIQFSWKASATIAVTPPGKAYNFALVEQYRNGPLSPSYPGHKPLTGESKSPLSNIITSMVLMYGLSMTAKFDATTYKRIEEQASGRISFGFFSIGVSQSYTKTTWDRDTYSLQTEPNDLPFIAAYYTDTLLG